VVDGHQQGVRSDERVEHVLQDVLGVAGIRHTAPDKAAEPGFFPGNDGRKPLSVYHLLM
jgi:hypothetical protein